MARTKEKVMVSMDGERLAWLDAQVQVGAYENRSAALEVAIDGLRSKLLDEEYERGLELLDPEEEVALAEEGMADYAKLVVEDEGEGQRGRVAP